MGPHGVGESSSPAPGTSCSQVRVLLPRLKRTGGHKSVTCVADRVVRGSWSPGSLHHHRHDAHSLGQTCPSPLHGLASSTSDAPPDPCPRRTGCPVVCMVPVSSPQRRTAQTRRIPAALQSHEPDARLRPPTDGGGVRRNHQFPSVAVGPGFRRWAESRPTCSGEPRMLWRLTPTERTQIRSTHPNSGTGSPNS